MKLLLVQTSFLGDTILSTPVIAALQALHPGAELSALTTRASAALLQRDPLVKRVLTFDKRGAEAGWKGLLAKAREISGYNFDIAYSLHRSARTACLLRLAGIEERVGFRDAKLSLLYTRRVAKRRAGHAVERFLSLVSPDDAAAHSAAELRLFPPPEEELRPELRALLNPSRGRLVVMTPGSVWPTKRWPAAHFRQVAEALSVKGWRVLLLGAPEEAAVGREVAEGLAVENLVGSTGIAETAALIKAARLLICNDSMPLHMASAFKVPAVAIFCATSPAFGFGPWRNDALIVEHQGLSCRPCRRHGSRRCPNGTEACMREVRPERVIAAAEELMERNKA